MTPPPAEYPMPPWIHTTFCVVCARVVCRRRPALSLSLSPPAVGPVPSAAAHFVLAVSPAAPGIATNVSAVVTTDAGVEIVAIPSLRRSAFTVTGLTPGTFYTLRASCEDATGATCVDVVHRWRSAPCPLLSIDSMQSVSVAPGERYVSWAPAASSFEYSVDGGPWRPVPELHPGVAPLGLMVCAGTRPVFCFAPPPRLGALVGSRA
jgi:hypothetical protein